ncbi:MAG: tyrosine--tRNA ligase [Lentisphaerae bacterium]|nr:tyrosine--tRNA ligase [Lentisphaerota bacterium]
MTNVIQVLRERCLLDNVTSDEVEGKMELPITVYGGFDPTSSSLQAGNLVAVMVLAHFQRCGHKVIALVGGATGQIGDPSGKTGDRALISREQVRENVKGIGENLERFIDFEHPSVPAELVDNSDWLEAFGYIEFLQTVGRHFRMGAMLGRDSVRTRLESDEGMSYTEFSYALLQAYDFLMLHDSRQCVVQAGGSDQWGNITAGVELVRKLRGAEVYGVTAPLVCDSSGRKFGKSEGNAVYLDHRLTSYFDFYQFFYRTADVDVIRFLKIFTFLSLDRIAELEGELKTEPESRVAQKALAEEVTRNVHGEKGLEVAQRSSAVLYGEAMDGLRAEDLMDIFADVPSTELSRAEVEGSSIVDVAGASGLCKSKGEARRLVESGGLYLNNVRVPGKDRTVAGEDIVDGRVLVLRSGKRNHHLVKVV